MKNTSTEKNYEYTIKVNNLKKSYGKKVVLKGVNLEVKKGEVFGLIGKNGAGKSTTIDCLVGLKEPTGGTIEICGMNIKKFPLDVKMKFGYVASEPVAYDMMTGKEFLEFVASSYGMVQGAFDANYDWASQKLNMPNEDLERHIYEYSHGMKQKVCLIGSLIHNPELWILDEPTVGLDIMVYKTLLDMIQQFADAGKTVFITSHNIELVQKVCDRVAIINNGVVDQLIDFNENELLRRDFVNVFYRTYGELVPTDK